MRWYPIHPEKTFLRFLRRLAELMDIPARAVCRPMAWHFWARNRWGAHHAFKFLATGKMP